MALGVTDFISLLLAYAVYVLCVVCMWRLEFLFVVTWHIYCVAIITPFPCMYVIHIGLHKTDGQCTMVTNGIDAEFCVREIIALELLSTTYCISLFSWPMPLICIVCMYVFVFTGRSFSLCFQTQHLLSISNYLCIVLIVVWFFFISSRKRGQSKERSIRAKYRQLRREKNIGQADYCCCWPCCCW